MHRLLLLALLLLAVAAPPTVRAQDSTLVVLVVRHAETTPDGRDPGLSEAGQVRAAVLAEIAAGAGVAPDAVYASQFRRTQETAAAVAAAVGGDVVTALIDPPRLAAYPDSVAARLRRAHPGGTAVVVSHSNLVPAIVAALGAPLPPPIDESTYDRLYVVVVHPDGTARSVGAQYGARGGR